MITLNIQNCLTETIEKKHGIGLQELSNALKENEPILKKLARQPWGFLELPYQDKKIIAKLVKQAEHIRKHFEHVIVIGIGGSSLGALALLKSLRPFYNEKPEIIFLDNPESWTVNHLMETIDLNKTLLLPISKSGGTIESLALFSVLYSRLGKNRKKQVIAITENNRGTLNTIAQQEDFPIFEIPKNVGGRFSVFSAAGLLPAAIAGINIEQLLKGARQAEPETAYLLALIQYLLYQKKKKTTVFFGYGRVFESIGDWYIQLLAESIGKTEQIGPTPLKAIGPADQHSQLQLFMEGPNDKWHLFLRVTEAKNIPISPLFDSFEPLNFLKHCNLHQLLLTEQKATAEALSMSNRPNITLTLATLNETGIGELLYLLELQVALLGELFNIDAFNQPGVELGKQLMKKFLNESPKRQKTF